MKSAKVKDTQTTAVIAVNQTESISNKECWGSHGYGSQNFELGRTQMTTNRDKVYRKFQLDKDKTYSLPELARITGTSLSVLKEVEKRG